MTNNSVRQPMAILLALGLLAGCASVDSTESEVHVFPRFKYARTGDFSLSRAERQAAVRLAHVERINLLCEVVVDQQGRVVNCRVIRGLPGPVDEDFFTHGFRQQIQEYQFPPSEHPAPYRTFFYPLKIKRKTEFL